MPSHLPASRSQFDDGKRLGVAHRSTKFPDGIRNQDPEHGLKLLGGEVITLFPKRIMASAVVTGTRGVERDFHEPLKRNRAFAPYLRAEEARNGIRCHVVAIIVSQ